MAGAETFCLLLGRLPKVSRCKSGTGIGNNVEAAGSRRREESWLTIAMVDEKSVIHPTPAGNAEAIELPWLLIEKHCSTLHPHRKETTPNAEHAQPNPLDHPRRSGRHRPARLE
jgi:hypothetical protein